MRINQSKFNQVVSEAKAKAANSPEWLRAIEKAARMMASGELVVTLFANNTALVTSPNGSYLVNGACPCAARTTHCYHRVAKRLAEMMETGCPDVSPAPRYCGDRDLQHLDHCAPHAPVEKTCTVAREISTGRARVIADIKRAWPATWPPLAVELMARFRKNQLEFLDDDMLRRVRLAISM